MKMRFDAKFTAFGMLDRFLDEFIAAQGLPPFYIDAKPETHHGMVLTAGAADCIHRYAKIIGAELTKPEYQPEESAEPDPTTAPCPGCVGKRQHSAEEWAQWHPQAGSGHSKEHGA